MTIGDERLGAYLDGELGADERAAVEAALAADAGLRARLERLQGVRAALHNAFPLVDDPVPEKLLALLEEPETNVVAFPARAAPRPALSGLQWAALAAAFAGALFIGRMTAPESGPFILRGGELYAGPRLERVLTTQLASAQNPNAATRIGLTFRARDGAFCRTFVLDGALSGLACREAGAWALRMTAPAAQRTGEFVQAAAEAPAVLEAASAIIEGEPFDAAGEAEAKRVGWR